MATWVISIRKSFVVGSTSVSEYGKAAKHASGSVKQRTLLHATSALPKKQNYDLAGNNKRDWMDNTCERNESSDRKFWQRLGCILLSLPLINVPILTCGDAEHHSVASSHLACQRFQIWWHIGDDRNGQPLTISNSPLQARRAKYA